MKYEISLFVVNVNSSFRQQKKTKKVVDDEIAYNQFYRSLSLLPNSPVISKIRRMKISDVQDIFLSIRVHCSTVRWIQEE
jgi:hypothetical protein